MVFLRVKNFCLDNTVSKVTKNLTYIFTYYGDIWKCVVIVAEGFYFLEVDMNENYLSHWS